MKEGGRDYVLTEAPFKAPYNERERKMPFLGAGYYYWDDNYDAAMWWGEKGGRSYKNGFFIIKSDLNLPGGIFFDLVGNREHMRYFVGLIDKYRKPPFNKRWSIGAFLEFLKGLTKLDPHVFPYKVIRAVDHQSPPDEHNLEPFVKDKDYYINLYPKLVICFLEKSELLITSKSIAYES